MLLRRNTPSSFFRGVTQFTYGYPNDEALESHPLYKLGMSFCAFNLIEHSPYLVELGRANAVAFPGTENQFIGRKHFVVSFHDETLEVVCRDLEFLGRVEAWNGAEAIDLIATPQNDVEGSPIIGLIS
jgi:hypothetical protein